ncbi:hypothetical protein GGF37_007507 [Kickxella alabastrina]|nr:hypothetical protein GGF37_007507 [Kickxella alabastrina]
MGKNDVLQEMANMSGINKTVSFLIQHADDIWGDAHYAKYSENTMGVAADGAADGNASVSGLAFAPPMSSVDAATDVQTTEPFPIPPMTRRKMNVGGIGIDVMSSPSSPSQQRYNPYYQQQQHGVAMGMDGDAQEGTSMSHSMPSPKGLCFDKNELMPSDRVSSQYKTANNGGGAYQKYSFDIPRK